MASRNPFLMAHSCSAIRLAPTFVKKHWISPRLATIASFSCREGSAGSQSGFSLMEVLRLPKWASKRLSRT